MEEDGYEDSVDVKDILLLNSEPKEEKYIISGDYIDRFPPLVEHQLQLTHQLDETVTIEERNVFEESDSNVGNTHKRKELMNVLNDKEDSETCTEIKIEEPEENILDESSEANSSSTGEQQCNERTVVNTRFKEKSNKAVINKGIKDKELITHFLWTCCSLHFSDFIAFSQHKLHNHNVNEHTCSICTNKSFPLVEDVEEHYISTHCNAMLTSFRCNLCRYAFGVQSSFTEHKCPCDAKKVCQQILESIIDSATESKAYSLGNKQIVKKRTKTNIKMKHVPFLFVCCEEAFDNFPEFSLHKLVKHKIEHLVCGLCYYEAKSTIYLYKHYINIHFSSCELAINNFKLQPEGQEEHLSSLDSSVRKTEDSVDSGSDCSTLEGDGGVLNGAKCTAKKEGILCQCMVCSKIVQTLQPVSGAHRIDRVAQQKTLLKPHVCKICQLRFAHKSILNKHLKTHLGFKNFPCDICGSSFTNHLSMEKHKLYKHSSNPFKVSCKVCSKVFCGKSSLRRHVQRIHLHQGIKVHFECSYCPKTFAHTKGLTRHINQNHVRGQEFICAHCNRIFYDKGAMSQHIQSVHLLQEKVTCELCGFVAVNKSRLGVHKYKSHSQNQYSCEICGKTFRFKKTLEIHRVTHFDEKPHVCQTCGKCFKRDCNLQQHQYTHSEKRPHLCSICGQSFRLRTHVKQHMAVHGLVKNHKCFICNKMFARKGELNLHLSNHGV